MVDDTPPIVRAKDTFREADGRPHPFILLQPDTGLSERYAHFSILVHQQEEIDKLKKIVDEKQ